MALNTYSRKEEPLATAANGDASAVPEPRSRVEKLLLAAANGENTGLPEPRTREEAFLVAVCDAIAGGGGGGGGGGGSTVELDTTLTQSGKAADAKAVGDALAGKQDTLIQSGATVGQIAKITAVDASGVPTAWSPVDMPDKLPNPNALTFTGAVTGSYDGSAAVTVNIPSAVTDDHINSLIDTKLGVIENGSY